MMRYCLWRNRNIDTVDLKKEKNMMKHVNKYLSLALALVLCLSLAACGESNEDYGDDGSDYNLYGVPDSFEGLVKGKTVIMIAHRLSTIQDADLILVMKQGELVESGTHDALVKQGGEYAKMWSNYTKTTKWHIGNEVKVC